MSQNSGQKNKRDQQQARWILAQGIVTRDQLTEVLGQLSGQSRGDLSSHLLARGLINPQQAMQARRASATTFNTVRQRSGRMVRDSLREHLQSGSGEYILTSQNTPATPTPPVPKPHTPKTAKIPTLGELQGKTFRDYTLIREISRGAMGIIFEARHPDHQKRLAIKFIQKAAPDDVEVERFRREMNALIQLRHKNIIEIYDAGSDNNRLFYVMEFIDGDDLYTTVERKFKETGVPLDWQSMVPVFTDVAKAIQYCHQNQLIHRDIKPQNIIIERETGRPVIVDFGLMKQDLEDDSKALTKTGEIIGTPAFMSPEQFSPGGSYGDIGPAIDVWGFGTSFFYCLTGQSPFQRQTVVEVFQAITTEAVPRAKERVATTPNWLDELIDSCLQKQADARPTIATIVEALQNPKEDSGNNQSNLTIILSIILGVCVLIIAIMSWLLFAKSRVAKVESLTAPKYCRVQQCDIDGQLNLSNASLKLKHNSDENRLDLQSNSSGKFTATLTLKPGLNQFTVYDADRPIKQFAITFDNKNPDITWHFISKNNSVKAINPDLPFKLPLEPGRIAISCPNESEATAEIGDQTVLIKANQKATVPLSARNTEKKIEIKVRDAAGNHSRSSLTLITQQEQALDSEEFALKLGQQSFFRAVNTSESADDYDHWRKLSEIKRWQSLAKTEIETICKALTPRLPKSFQFKEVRSTKLLDKSCYYAVFEQSTTAQEFSLTPGGVTQFTLWQFAKDAQVAEYLNRLATATGSGPLHIAIRFPEQTLGKDLVSDLLKSHPISQSKRPNKLIEEWQYKAILSKYGLNSIRAWAQRKLQEHLLKRHKKCFFYVAPMLVSLTETSVKTWNKLPDMPCFHTTDRLLAKMPETVPVIATFEEVQDWIAKAAENLSLPLPWEWRYLCDAGNPTGQFWHTSKNRDNDESKRLMSKFAWYRNPKERYDYFDLHDVNEHKENYCNAFGLSDTLGNAYEWCLPPRDKLVSLWPANSSTATPYIAGASCNSYDLIVDSQHIVPWFQGSFDSNPRIGFRLIARIPAPSKQ